jgi:hypothetical protein
MTRSITHTRDKAGSAEMCARKGELDQGNWRAHVGASSTDLKRGEQRAGWRTMRRRGHRTWGTRHGVSLSHDRAMTTNS